MATIQDIADKLGISKGTVSKALNGASDISETLQKNVIETAVELGYTKIRRPGGQRKLCILIENIDYQEPHQFGYEIILGFRQMAEPAGYTVDIVPVTEKLQKASSYDAFMLRHDYLGSFILGFSLSDCWMKDFQTSHTPTVLYDNYIMANPHIGYVGVDNNEGMELAVEHLKSLGHRKVGYLSHALGSHIMQVRHKAFFSALRQNGLPADSSLAGSSYYISQCMEKHLPRLLKEGVTGIICSHDLIASAALVQCQQMGLRVPGDVSIIGFDDLPICAYTSPPLTTVRQERIQLGKSGYYALESLMNGVAIGTLLLHASLVVRQSTDTARKKADPDA
ncbi:LacI family DNA-binding transcriptional regulator [Mordavella massiliensis]|uniref:LacI family DNA-binding transcriptional regulator n=1 Tax=Mordavella massiliensis TaxID=1871024 RepID=A0A938XBN2_9CLOT|nr:LacI family DNA-binding transcriptional regulator [Mordavella massiliensis]MBM6947870.1 LacI family DNA-binding transcriptional regulator [Mordavella massiliensis]